MSEWKHTASKRQSGSTDSDHSKSYPVPFVRHFRTSQSSGKSLSPHSSLEEGSPSVADHQLLFTTRPGVSLEAVLTHLEAPSQTSTSRTLPSLSPTDSANYTLPSISLPSPWQSPHTSRQVGRTLDVGANDITTQTLQREYCSLVSAYSLTQTRIADLDEAAQASNLETERLSNDRQRLKAKVDVLEAEIDELQNSIEVSRQHSATKDAQYSQIVDLSTRLQTQSAFDTQQWRVEQEQWANEKQLMQDTIAKLRSEVRDLQLGLTKSTASCHDRLSHDTGTSPQSIPTSTIRATLAQHSNSLQQANASIEAALIDISNHHLQLNDHVEKLGSIGKNIQTQVQYMSELDGGLARGLREDE